MRPVVPRILFRRQDLYPLSSVYIYIYIYYDHVLFSQLNTDSQSEVHLVGSRLYGAALEGADVDVVVAFASLVSQKFDFPNLQA